MRSPSSPLHVNSSQLTRALPSNGGLACSIPCVPRWDRLSRKVSTPSHLMQLLSRAIVAGLLARHTSSSASGRIVQSPGLPILNSVLQALAGGRSPGYASSLYGAMRRVGVAPDDYTFTFLLKAAAHLGDSCGGEQLHSLSLTLGYESSVFVQNSLIHMYFASGMLVSAEQVFGIMPHVIRDVISWNSMISGYVKNGRCREALDVFVEMVHSYVAPDTTTMVNVLVACGRTGASDAGRQIHGSIVVNGCDLDFFLGSSLIDMYAKCGFIDWARRVFNSMPRKNTVCWTSMISGYAHAGEFKASVELFRDMQMAGVEPDEATIASVISSCGHLGALDQGRWVHTYCDASGIRLNIRIKNALIDLYSKCGDVKRALQIFHDLEHRDVFSWTAMISGLAINGFSEEALNLFSQMEFFGTVTPNGITFLGVLTACSHAGRLDKGFYYFSRMTCVYKLTPRIEHYGCMVDLLGRAKLVTEALSFIRNMPIQPDAVIWRSLLFACRNSGNIELAELAIQYMSELEPRKTGVHIMLSNVYASASKWRDVNVVRKDMSKLGLRKQPGCSCIETNGVVHEFFVSDTSHPLIDVIHQMVLGLNELLWSEGCFSCSRPKINEVKLTVT